MGRRRKQPRRIVTFNINEDLADAIDDLQLPNRSEWMNRVLPDILAGEGDRRNLRAGGARALESIDNDLLFATAFTEGIMDTVSDDRLILILLNRFGQPANPTNIIFVKNFLLGKRPRAPFVE